MGLGDGGAHVGTICDAVLLLAFLLIGVAIESEVSRSICLRW